MRVSVCFAHKHCFIVIIPNKLAGITPSKQTMDDLLTDRPGAHDRIGSSSSMDDSDRGINFAMFLTMMSEHLFDFDTEAELVDAFACFDESDSGMVKGDEISKWISETGERMDQKEVRDPQNMIEGLYSFQTRLIDS